MSPTRRFEPRTDVTYLAVLALLFGTSFVPHLRLWGLSVWSPLPASAKLLLLVLGLVPLALLYLQAAKGGPEHEPAPVAGSYTWRVILGVVGATAVFTLLAARTHFLGDGYLVLSNLASESPLIRGRNYGAVVIQLGLLKLLPGAGEEAALLAFRIVSIVSGALAIAVLAWSAGRLFGAAAQRRWWVFGIATGGYTLLFFGYVENYALLILAVIGFACVGLTAALRACSRWLILVPLALALFVHTLGIVLVPAALYLLLSSSRPGHWLADRSRATKLATGLLLLAAAGALFYYLYATDYYFRFAFVAPWADRFTVDGYTLFAPVHLLDYLNLLLLLVPGLPLLFAPARAGEGASRRPHRPVRFLSVLVISALGAVFVLDPKLGMARDWDLLAFAGVPVAVLMFYLLLHAPSPQRLRAAVLAACLGTLCLLPRAVVQRVPEYGIALTRSYLELDVSRSRTGVQLLGQYLLDRGIVAEYADIAEFREQNYPEEAQRMQVEQLANLGREDEAAMLCRRIIERNPRLFSAWSVLGFIYNNRGLYDSARVYLEIADGLNPDAAGVLNELGRAYFYTHRSDEAYDLWLRSISLDSSQYIPYLALARWHRARGEQQAYGDYLARAVARRGAPYALFVELTGYLVERDRLTEAREVVSEAVRRGADSASIAALREAYPQLDGNSD